MMVPILYTNSDQIRAVAGLSDEDIDDDTMVARELTRELTTDLYTWLPTHASIYGSTTTTSAQYLSDCLRLYCAHYAAALLLRSPMLLRQSVEDGNNALARFATLDIAKLGIEMMERAASYRAALVAGLSSTAATPPTLFGLSNPQVDPVTGA